VKERERERRDRQTDRQTDTQTDRQTDTHTNIEKVWKTLSLSVLTKLTKCHCFNEKD